MCSGADHFASPIMEDWPSSSRGEACQPGPRSGGRLVRLSESDPRAVPCPQQQHTIVSVVLRCIIVQLVSIADDLATSGEDDADHAGSPPLSNSTHEDSDHPEEATVLPSMKQSTRQWGRTRWSSSRRRRSWHPTRTPARSSSARPTSVCTCAATATSKRCRPPSPRRTLAATRSPLCSLFAHVVVFDGHTPPLPPPDADADTNYVVSLVHGSVEQPPASGEALNVGSMFSDFRCSRSRASLLDDGREKPFSPIDIDFCDFEGFDLLDAVAMDF
ncbi:unnamed protein product [Alopecurus aequalis]